MWERRGGGEVGACLGGCGVCGGGGCAELTVHRTLRTKEKGFGTLRQRKVVPEEG